MFWLFQGKHLHTAMSGLACFGSEPIFLLKASVSRDLPMIMSLAPMVSHFSPAWESLCLTLLVAFSLLGAVSLKSSSGSFPSSNRCRGLVPIFLHSEYETKRSPQSSYWARFVAVNWHCRAHSSQHLEAFNEYFLLSENWHGLSSLVSLSAGVTVLQHRFVSS